MSTEKPNWLEEWQEEIRRENKEALRREYERCVEEDLFPDSKEHWQAFVYGWCGTHDFQRAKKELNETGQNAYLSMVLLWLIGGLMTALSVYVIVMAHDRIDPLRTSGIVVLGLLMLYFGERMRRRWLRKGKEAGDAFRAKWSEAASDE